jgi:hypothetical protein
VTPTAQRRTARRSARRWTPATLPGVAGRPISARAWSTVSATPDIAEVLTDIGIAQNSAAAAADAQISPAVLEFADMISSLCFVGLLHRLFYLGEPLAGLIHVNSRQRPSFTCFGANECYLRPHSGHRVAKVGRIDKIEVELRRRRSGIVAMADRAGKNTKVAY